MRKVFISFGYIPKWRREWQTTSVFLLQEHHKQYERQKDTTLADEPSSSVDVQHGTGEEWRNNSRKNEEADPKQKCSIVDVPGGETKV